MSGDGLPAGRAAAGLDAHYRSRSLWLAGLPGPLVPRPSLPGDVSCDVVVVGAGFTGLWTAYYLKRHQPDLRVVVLEREIAGYGPSGRNGGWVSGGIAGSWGVYERASGADAVRRATRETFRTVDEIGDVVVREGIGCRYVKAGMLSVATTEPQRARLVADVAVARARGLADDDLRGVATRELPSLVRIPGCLFATYSPHGARVDPARLVRGLADACELAGVALYERTEAEAVLPGGVRCAGGRVRADHVVLATEASSGPVTLPGGRRQLLPLASMMVATEPLPARVWDDLAWPDGLLVRDRRHLFFYAQRTADGRLAIGGRGIAGEAGGSGRDTTDCDPVVRRRLVATVRHTFPVAAGARIAHAWGGRLAVPRDWCMTVGARPGLCWAGGYAGHGMVASNIAGRTLTDLVLRRDTELVTLPWVGHRSRRWEPEPFRSLVARSVVRTLGNADRYEDRCGRPSRRARAMAPFLVEA